MPGQPGRCYRQDDTSNKINCNIKINCDRQSKSNGQSKDNDQSKNNGQSGSNSWINYNRPQKDNCKNKIKGPAQA